MADTHPVQPHKALYHEILNDDFITRDTVSFFFYFSLDSPNYGAILGYQIVLYKLSYHVMARVTIQKVPKECGLSHCVPSVLDATLHFKDGRTYLVR